MAYERVRVMSTNKYDVSIKAGNKAQDCTVEIVNVPMRDGVKLYTVVYLPQKGSKHDVIFIRTPYSSTKRIDIAPEFYLKNNLAYILQSCRGTGLSESEFTPLECEEHDAQDAIAWIMSQEWFGGKIAMTGGSYCGLTQWMASRSSSQYLSCITPGVACSNVHDKLFIGGAFFLQLHMHWAMSMMYKTRTGQDTAPDWDAKGLAKYLPLIDMDIEALGSEVSSWRKWINSCDDYEYWKNLSVNEIYEDIQCQSYMYGGWYDFYCNGTLENFVGMRTRGGSEKARKYTKCIMGPWTHSGLSNKDIFGEENVVDIAHELTKKYLVNCLKDSENDPLPDEPAIKYFLMGKNEWQEADTWPPEGVVEEKYFISSSGNANSRFGDGMLSCKPETEDCCDVFIYDPRNPVPSMGGCYLGPGQNGCVDQSEVEARCDILVYKSEPLEEELTITGKVRVTLFASCNSLDTDFTAKLVDIYPDGKVLNLCDGIIRARYRNSLYAPELLERDIIYEYEIDCWHTANCFRKGHRIGLDISSSNFPRFDRNPNTGNTFGLDDEMKVSRQTVYHGRSHQSCVILPVLKK